MSYLINREYTLLYDDTWDAEALVANAVKFGIELHADSFYWYEGDLCLDHPEHKCLRMDSGDAKLLDRFRQVRGASILTATPKRFFRTLRKFDSALAASVMESKIKELSAFSYARGEVTFGEVPLGLGATLLKLRGSRHALDDYMRLVSEPLTRLAYHEIQSAMMDLEVKMNQLSSIARAQHSTLEDSVTAREVEERVGLLVARAEELMAIPEGADQHDMLALSILGERPAIMNQPLQLDPKGSSDPRS